jgi:hypothetical protein
MNAAGQTTLARDVIGHAIPTPKVPTAPTLIRPLPQKPLQAVSLDELARHVHQLRGERGLRIAPVGAASYGGSDTFFGFSLWAIDPLTGGEDYIGFAAVQSQTDTALRAALTRTEQKAAA